MTTQEYKTHYIKIKKTKVNINMERKLLKWTIQQFVYKF